MEKILNGNTRVYEQLLSCREHRRRLEKIARKNTRGTAVSWEDAVQTAHFKVFQAAKAGKFCRGGVSEFYRWAATVARYEIIDLVRKEKQFNCMSLDRNIPGTDLPLLETISDEFNLLDSLERTDLVFRAIEAISFIDRCYPHRGYLKLWQGKVKGKSQVQLAADLGISQGAISKRWKELIRRIAEELGLLESKDIQLQLKTKTKQKAVRSRSKIYW